MFKNQEGQRVPEVTFRARDGAEWHDLKSADIFNGRTVVLFSLPGAFTPTCSSSHLPRYEELLPVFKANGVDEVVCVSVNDGFVMEAWAKDQKIEGITLLPDGNGEFTEKMGFLIDKADLGFGKRSWRYSMLVKDGVVMKTFVEPNKPGDPFEVSDADTMLKAINPDAALPPEITLFSKPGCPFCQRAKALLEARGLRYEEIAVTNKLSNRTLRNVTGRETVPQIYIDGAHIGGLDDLTAHFA